MCSLCISDHLLRIRRQREMTSAVIMLEQLAGRLVLGHEKRQAPYPFAVTQFVLVSDLTAIVVAHMVAVQMGH